MHKNAQGDWGYGILVYRICQGYFFRMRLSAAQISNLRKAVTSIIKDVTEIRVFGSRLDDSRKGGDLDLVVESEHRHGILEKADLKIALEGVLGLPVDVLLVTRNGAQSVFERMAMSKSQPLP